MRNAMALSFLVFGCGIGVMANGQEPAGIKMEHPGDTALSQVAPGEWEYKSFPGLAKLYTYQRDEPSKSHCTEGCASAWPPLRVSAGESDGQVGDWTVIKREDGSRQWAYKGHPVYIRYHDLPDDGSSVAEEGFHLLKP